ncbi:MAG: OmpA family protein [Bacteroidales bacterium]|nr:OmpA family protein [Bacteroidales bacterium]
MVAEKIVVEAPAHSVELRNISFAFNSYKVEQTYLSFLDKLAQLMKDEDDITLTISGFADALGNKEYNKILSGKRAEQVKSYLIKQGIAANRIKTVAQGSSGFIAVNSNPDGSDNAEGRKFNRRVEITPENLPAETIVVKQQEIPEELKISK